METAQECYALFPTFPGISILKRETVWPPTSHLSKHPNKTRWVMLVKQVKTYQRRSSYGLLRMDTLVLTNKQRLTYISYVLTLDAV